MSIGTVTPLIQAFSERTNDCLDDLFPLNQISASEKLYIMQSIYTN